MLCRVANIWHPGPPLANFRFTSFSTRILLPVRRNKFHDLTSAESGHLCLYSRSDSVRAYWTRESPLNRGSTVNNFVLGQYYISFCTLFFLAMIASSDVWLSFLTKKLPEEQREKINLNIYGCLVGASIIFTLIRAYGFLSVSLTCSECLHDKMVVAVLQAPVLFFDSNPVGRIMNRFSKDVGCMDEELPKIFLRAIQLMLMLFTSILVPTVTNPWILFVVVPMTLLAVLISRYYLKTSRELKRLESICRSPVFSHISETLDGLETIRTRRHQRDFVHRFYRYVQL